MYTELHARSAFSFLEGSATPEELAAVCAAGGMGAMALLDRDGVYGSPRFHLAAKKLPLQAHIGAEVTSPEGWRYPLLVESQAGYQNLCRLITRMKLRAKKGEGHVSPEEIAASSPGLICLTGGDEGPLASALAHGGNRSRAAPSNSSAPLRPQQRLRRTAAPLLPRRRSPQPGRPRDRARCNCPLLATNGVCYAQPRSAKSSMCSPASATTAPRHAGKLLARNSDRHLEKLPRNGPALPDLPEAIANTQLLSSAPEIQLNDLGYQFPKYPTSPTANPDSFLRKRTDEGILRRYGPKNDPALLARASRSTASSPSSPSASPATSSSSGTSSVLPRTDILVQGRGSAANSAVCYALEITAVDPVGMDLLFERFLSENRGEWPDIDLDLPSGDQREQAIQYVYQRYGELGAAMTANVITYRGAPPRAKSARPSASIRKPSAASPRSSAQWEWRARTTRSANSFRDAGFDVQHPRIANYLELCVRLQDLPRHLGQHSGGMVICQGQLDSVVPLEPASMPGRTVVQWDKEDCADMGIIKVDLLGLGMMAVLKDCLTLIPRALRRGNRPRPPPPKIPSSTKVLQKADTVGMFPDREPRADGLLPRNASHRFYDSWCRWPSSAPAPSSAK
jgi:error-prone DNA polymerase